MNFLLPFAIAAFSLAVFSSHLIAQERSLEDPRSNANRANRYDVAAYVWPSYHPDDRARMFWPDGIGEWETVIKSKAKFPGHQHPRVPIWGYTNEADPYVMEMQIDAAADHGVNVFIFDWYWYDRLPFLEGCLNDGYLKARNNERVKFYLMWANHDAKLMWDRRNADDVATKKNKSIVWKGAIDREEFEIVVNRWIDQYFHHPSYYKIDGKPVVMIYDLANLVAGLGGIEETADAMKWFRSTAKDAGFPDVELQVTLRKGGGHQLTGVDGGKLGNQDQLIEDLGFDSLTHYQFVHMTNVDRDYKEIIPDVVRIWNEVDRTSNANYHPHVSIGWDNSPRKINDIGPVIKDNTPARFKQALKRAKEFVDQHPDQPPLITINSWNEWTETSYLQPCRTYGYGYLEAVRSVFLDSEIQNKKMRSTNHVD